MRCTDRHIHSRFLKVQLIVPRPGQSLLAAHRSNGITEGKDYALQPICILIVYSCRAQICMAQDVVMSRKLILSRLMSFIKLACMKGVTVPGTEGH